MAITRRDFLKYCGLSAAALGLSSLDLFRLQEALANPTAPKVIWLQGSGCTGCSISFLNFINTAVGADPTDPADILRNHIDLIYHPSLMFAAGQDAAALANQAFGPNGYVLAVEGGIPTAMGGRTCFAWKMNGADVTLVEAVTQLSVNAAKILSIGTCASFGGIPAAGPNPTGVKGVRDLFTGNTAITNKVINVAGCPAHPDWTVYAIAQILLGNTIPLDANGRPTAIYGQTVHSRCPRNVAANGSRYTTNCLAQKGCRGPGTYGNCPTILWNNKTNWCVNANAPCYACTEATFPGDLSLYTVLYNYNPHGEPDMNCAQCHD